MKDITGYDGLWLKQIANKFVCFKTVIVILILTLAGTAAANSNTCVLIQIDSTHWYFETTQTDLLDGEYNYQAYVNNIDSDYRILEVNITAIAPTYTPPEPINIGRVTGNFWINHTWNGGLGNASDSYNTTVNSVWYNGTSAYYNDTYIAHAWQNITVFAYNSSGTGTLSTSSINQNTQIPNNPITITNTSDWIGDTGDNVYVDYDAIDADSDAVTFSCDRMDLFTDFDNATGQGNWSFIAGVYYVEFGVSDGYGSVSNYTMCIGIPDHPLLIGSRKLYNSMTTGLTNMRDSMGKYLVWGVIFFSVTLAFAIFGKIKNMLIGGK